MPRIATWSVLSIACCAANVALGRAPLIDPPTPPPCAADGICYPNTGGWGYYPARWRTWPGVQLEPTPSKSPTAAEGRVSEELGHSETPPADLEDAAAPPSSARPRKEPAAAESGEPPAATPPGGETGLPDVPLPDAESASPLGPTSDHDPPPALPQSLTATSPATRQIRAAATSLSRPASPQVSTSDPPPSPPWAQSAAL